MSLQQVYYTSCKRGLRGGAGFQINAASSGLDAATLALIERFSVYQPPLHLAYDRQAALSAFPQALAYYRLGSEIAVVARSIYLGATAADARGGNFFTHSLVSLHGAGAFGQLVPAQLWSADHWAAEEVDTLELPELPTPPRPVLELATIERFLHAERERIDWLAPLIDTALSCINDQRRLLLIAPADECAHWIAAITLAMPRHLAYELTFTTYARDTAQFPFHIVGLDPGTVASSHLTMAPDSYVFHPPKDIRLRDTPGGRFAAFVADSYRRGNLAALRDFIEMTGRMSRPPTIEALESLAALPQFSPAPPNDRSATLRQIQFARTVLDEDVAIVEPVLERLAKLDPMDDAVQEAWLELLHATQQVDSDTAATVAGWCMTWIGRHFLPMATPAALARMAQGLASTRLTAALLQRIEPDVRAAIEQASAHPQQLMALVRFVDATRLDRELGDACAAALRALAVYMPEDAAILRFFVERVLIDDSTADDLLYAGMIRDSDDPGRLDRWQVAFANDAVRSMVLARSREESRVPLYIYCTTFHPPAGEDRSTTFAKLIQSLTQEFPKISTDAPLLDRWYLARAFPEPSIAPAEARLLFNMIAPRFLALTSLYDKIAAGALAHPALHDDEYLRLLQNLRSAEQYATARSRPSTEWIRALSAWRRQLAAPGASGDIVDAVRALFEALPAGHQPLRPQVLAATLEALAPLERPDLSRQFMRALPEYEDELWAAFAIMLDGQHWPVDDQAAQFGWIFESLVGLTRRDDRAPALDLLDEPLRARWAALPAQDRKWIDRQLRVSPVAQDWESWQERDKKGWLQRWRKR